ncbi:MAG: hypothetical protein IJB97_04350, partial [Clostridia bacterium]|nr:hypothetical protein [Clostridia bacterium]
IFGKRKNAPLKTHHQHSGISLVVFVLRLGTASIIAPLNFLNGNGKKFKRVRAYTVPYFYYTPINGFLQAF